MASNQPTRTTTVIKLDSVAIPRTPTMEEVHIDIRDLDYRWCEDVLAYLDRYSDTYYFTRESAERLGELDEENGNFYLTAADVEAEVDEIAINGQATPVWSVRVGQLVTRPAKQ